MLKLKLKPAEEVTVTLFDLDGVLIRPLGYRAAVKATVNYFSQKMGLGDREPTENELAFFEAHGVTSEWDMVPICLAFLVERVRSVLPVTMPDVSILDLISLIQGQNLEIKTNYRADFERLVPFLDPTIPAAESFLLAVQNGNLFPEARNAVCLQELLGNTRQPTESIPLRVFQNFILGDQGFQQAYSIPASFITTSYLESLDMPLLSAQSQAWLGSLIKAAAIRPAAITARPSLCPPGVEDGLKVYSPEAEMAIRLSGLGAVPMVGYGAVQYLAGQIGIPAENLVKPSPVQALAGIGVALGYRLQESLFWAAACGLGTRQGGMEIRLPSSLALHIFEDSTIGIVACQRAAALLVQAGYRVSLQAWGIAQNPDKIKALESVGARVYADVNQAVQEALGHLL